jgi:hypothetical protein
MLDQGTPALIPNYELPAFLDGLRRQQEPAGTAARRDDPGAAVDLEHIGTCSVRLGLSVSTTIRQTFYGCGNRRKAVSSAGGPASSTVPPHSLRRRGAPSLRLCCQPALSRHGLDCRDLPWMASF